MIQYCIMLYIGLGNGGNCSLILITCRETLHKLYPPVHSTGGYLLNLVFSRKLNSTDINRMVAVLILI